MKKLFVILSAIMLAIVFVMPAGAIDWDFYGSARMQTFHVYEDKNANTRDFDDRDTTWGLNSVSRIGATVKEGDVGGRFEYGTGVNLRRLYGTWDFGAGELLVGKEYTPIFFIANQTYPNDCGLGEFGGLFSRFPMIQVKIDGFKLAMISPNTNLPDNMDEDTKDGPGGTDLVTTMADYDTIFPKIEASYTLAMDTFSLRLFGGWNAFEAVGTNDKEYDITCYVYGVAGIINAGPATLKAMFWNGQNVGLYGLTVDHGVNFTPDYLDTTKGDKVKDNNGFGGIASIGFKINDAIGVEAGYGYISAKDDIANAHDDEAWAAYLQAPITLAQGVTIVPEIGHCDYEEDGDGENEGHQNYFGAKWQINF